MARSWEMTNTNVQVNANIMTKFKQVIKKEGYVLGKGLEIAMLEHIKKHSEPVKNEKLLKALS